MATFGRPEAVCPIYGENFLDQRQPIPYRTPSRRMIPIHPTSPHGSGREEARRSISRVLYHRGGDDHSSGPTIAGWFSRPTRTSGAVNPATEAARRPYLVLLQARFTLPSSLPKTRWALTPPFHPYPDKSWRFAFCGTVSRVTPGGRYPPPFHRGARTFLDRGKPCRDRPTVWRGLSERFGCRRQCGR